MIISCSSCGCCSWHLRQTEDAVSRLLSGGVRSRAQQETAGQSLHHSDWYKRVAALAADVTSS